MAHRGHIRNGSLLEGAFRHMSRYKLDREIERKEIGGFAFALGVYPTSSMEPKPGYIVEFESADSDIGAPEDISTLGASGEWEEWPDRFLYDVSVSHTRVRSMCRLLFRLLPGRVYPILDILGRDEYREIDPYIAYDAVGLDRYLETITVYGDWLFEDGLVGFGAMSLDPFLYIFVDEHKVVTVRAEFDLKARIEQILRAFELQALDEIRGADAADHEHRSVLLTPKDDNTLLSIDEIVEDLRDLWRLQLNIDPTVNVDDEGKKLGITGWYCIGRAVDPNDPTHRKYAEVLVTGDCLNTAEELVEIELRANLPEPTIKNDEDRKETDQGVTHAGYDEREIDVVTCERVAPERFAEMVKASDGTTDGKVDVSRVHGFKWISS